MKYFSEELNKNFDTEEECKQAEAEYKEKKEKEETAFAERKSAISKKKKELSDSIKVVDDDVREAYNILNELKGRKDLYALFENDLPDTYTEK